MRHVVSFVAIAALISCSPDPVITDHDYDGYDEGDDCDDTDPAINPGASERCDGVDNDCDGDVDEDDGVVDSPWYADVDEDGFGDVEDVVHSCSQPEGYVEDGTDCDDADAMVSPGAAELCNDVDDDCDGVADYPEPTELPEWYADTDGDGYGDPGATTAACDVPTGYVANADDCDDGDSDIHPGAEDVCDGVDTNCDGVIDPDDAVGLDEACPAESCKEIFEADASAGTGEYWLDTTEGPMQFTCEMGALGGGWTELFSFNVAMGGDCPGTWERSATVATCEASAADGYQSSAAVRAYGIPYQEVSATVQIRQFGSTDAFHGKGDVTPGGDLDGAYVDGVSFTYGEPRAHVFTYGVGLSAGKAPAGNCPDAGGIAAPDFVGTDYACATANTDTVPVTGWVNEAVGLPQFQTDLGAELSDDLEVRLLLDETDGSENVGISVISVYIR